MSDRDKRVEEILSEFSYAWRAVKTLCGDMLPDFHFHEAAPIIEGVWLDVLLSEIDRLKEKANNFDELARVSRGEIKTLEAERDRLKEEKGIL